MKKHRWLVVLVSLILSLAGCRARAAGNRETEVTAFVHVNLVSMTDEIVLEDQTVVVEGTRIVAVGAADEVAVPGRAAVIDGAGAYLMPGLADMHTHSQDDWVGSDNWPVSPLNLFLANGVTTIRDCGHTGDISLPLRWRDEIEAGTLDGPDIYTTGSVMWGDRRGPIYDGVVQEENDRGYHFLKIKTSFSSEFHAVMQGANQLGVYTVGHIPYQVGLEGVLAAGLDEIAHVEEFYFDHLAIDPGSRLTEEAWFSAMLEASLRLFEDAPGRPSMEHIEETYGPSISASVDRLRSTGTLVGITIALNDVVEAKVNDPQAFLARPQNRYLSRDCRERVERGEDRHQLQIGELERRGMAHLLPYKFLFDRAVLRKLHSAGIPLLLAPDSGGRELCVVPGYSTHDELRALVENGFTPYEALVTATVNAGRVVEAMTGIGDVGTIEVGKRADLLMVGADPLQDVAHAQDILGVMAAGRWYSREALAELIALGQ
jgi:hypothetical protein